MFGKPAVGRCQNTVVLKTTNLARNVRVFDKGKQYNQIMQEKMQWTSSPFEYDFDRGLYYHHILSDQLLCGSQPTNADDISYLKEAEKVDVIVSVRYTEELLAPWIWRWGPTTTAAETSTLTGRWNLRKHQIMCLERAYVYGHVACSVPAAMVS